MKEYYDDSFCRTESDSPYWVRDGVHPAVVRKAELVRNGDEVDMVLELQPFGYLGAESRRVRDLFRVAGYPEQMLEFSRRREAEFLEACFGVPRDDYRSTDLIGRVVRVATSSEDLADDEDEAMLVSLVVGYEAFTECSCQFQFAPALPDFVVPERTRLDSANPGSRDSSAKVGDDPQTQIASSDDAEKSGG